MISALFNSVFGFLILMGVLVTLHEFGHFYAAKKLGFKVLTFSIGFGKRVWSRTGKDGVEYRIGLIPLGGYVGFLDDRAHDVKAEELDQTFNAKPVWKRAVVIAAGPIVNLVFAVILLFGLYLYGMPAFKAKIDTPLPNSALSISGFERGDEIVSIEGRQIRTFDDMVMGFVEHLNDGVATIEVMRNGRVTQLEINMDEPLRLNANDRIDKKLGISLYMPLIPAKVAQLTENGVAITAGVQKGDIITRINERDINSWPDLLYVMSELDLQDKDALDLEIFVDRAGETILLPAVTTRGENGRFLLGLGVGQLTPEIEEEIESMKTLQKYPLFEAMRYAVLDAYQNSLLIFKFIGRMVTGEVHPNMMAGPVTIADAAGKKLDAGWVYFIQLMALFSVNLGILNLLPIPVLDGGRLVGLGIEATVGKNKIPASLSMRIMQIGGLFLFMFMAFVIFYDIMKWF